MRFLLQLLLAVAPFIPASLALADPRPAAEVQPAAGAEAALLESRLAEAQAVRLRFEESLASATNGAPPGATQPEVILYRSLLLRLGQSYREHLDDLSEAAAIRQRRADFEREASAWSGFPEQPPFSVLLADEVRDRVQLYEEAARLSEAGLLLVDRLADHIQANRQDAERRARHFREQLEGSAPPARHARLTWQLQVEQLRERAGGAMLAAGAAKRAKVQEELAENRARLALASRQLAAVGSRLRFDQADLDAVLSDLDVERARLCALEHEAVSKRESSRAALAEARAALAQARGPGAQAEAPHGPSARLAELVELRHVQAQSADETLSAARSMVNGIDIERQLWQMRFALFGETGIADLQESLKKLKRLAELIDASRAFFEQQRQLAADQITEEESELPGPAGLSRTPELARERLASLRGRADGLQRVLDGLARHQRMIDRWKDAFAARRQSLPAGQRLLDTAAWLKRLAERAWAFELVAVEDTITVDGQAVTGRRGITVGKVAVALLILAAGYWLTRRAARVLERLAVARLGIEPNHAGLVRRWTHIVFMVVVIIVVFESVKIPLTIFAFAGGALAIGIGFGTQNLLKNFISGIIILFERPFRVGDVIDVGGERGVVTNIGIRSSVIRQPDDTETLIPNSALLENNLTNWTYSNRHVRHAVAVGVAYGSDTRRVAQLLSEVADRHGLVLKEPKPQVLFADFADSTLNFELRVWSDVVKHNPALLCSDLRHMIAASFAENGIAIAFPQRDLHLDASRPLEIRLAPPAEPPAGAPPAQPRLPD